MRDLSVPALLAAAVSSPVLAQDLTHPQDMNLPASNFERPDLADYQLSLENGLVAYVAEAGHVPLVTLSAFIHAGKVSDEQQGAAEALQAALLHAGPQGRSDFKVVLKRMTAEFTVDLHDEWTEVTLNVPVADLDAALPLFASLLRNPEITKDSIERAAASAAPGNEDLGGESGAALYEGSMDTAVDRFHDILYADHPYGYRPSAKDYDRLRPRDVSSFHATTFVPGNVTLAVAGQIDVDAVNTKVEELFGDWQAADVPSPPAMPPVEYARAATHRVPANKLQSWMVMGHELPQIPLERQAAFDVMDYILGAYHLDTRLMRETRYKYGYTNDASSFPDPRWHGPGVYTFRSYSRPEVIRNIYDNMLRELVRMRSEEVTDRELFVAKGALADGLFAVRYTDGYAMTRNFALERLRYGNHDRSANYVERIRSVTKEDVLDAAKRYIRPDALQVVLVGDGEL